MNRVLLLDLGFNIRYAGKNTLYQGGGLRFIMHKSCKYTIAYLTSALDVGNKEPSVFARYHAGIRYAGRPNEISCDAGRWPWLLMACYDSNPLERRRLPVTFSAPQRHREKIMCLSLCASWTSRYTKFPAALHRLIDLPCALDGIRGGRRVASTAKDALQCAMIRFHFCHPCRQGSSRLNGRHIGLWRRIW